jgi:3-hydroxyacyl-CoA dehydrogenase
VRLRAKTRCKPRQSSRFSCARDGSIRLYAWPADRCRDPRQKPDRDIDQQHRSGSRQLTAGHVAPICVADADLVQEAAPEREPLKIKLFADIDSILPPPAILVSSTSGTAMSRVQSECKQPERCVTGHPFNPPHLMRLVEVVGGAKTSAETIERAMRFYTAIAKRALHIRKEVAGHVANLGSTELGPEVQKKIVDGVLEEVAGRSKLVWRLSLS